MINLILIGAPGSGKGTQAKFIKKDFDIAHISTGDMFRENIKNNTELGLEAQKYMDKGDLVPDEVTVNMISERLKQDDCKTGFMLDGFPRTIEQAKALDEMLKSLNIKLNAVLNLKADDAEVLKRLLSRGRSDDNEATIKNRLNIFKNQSEPILDHYQDKTKIIDVLSEGLLEDIYANIKESLKEI